MAPRRRRSKVGLTRMHAALDAMRPLGFSADAVRKCVKNLLKVYGNDGWAFIEEAAYKLLIDTILEEPVIDQIEHDPEHLTLENGPRVTDEPPEKDVNEPETRREDINVKQEKSEEQDLNVAVTPVLLQDVNTQREVGLQLGVAFSFTPQAVDIMPTNIRRKPCYGWISDDDDDDDDDNNIVQ